MSICKRRHLYRYRESDYDYVALFNKNDVWKDCEVTQGRSPCVDGTWDNHENIMVTRLTRPRRRTVHRIIVRRKIGFTGPLEKLGKSNEGGLILTESCGGRAWERKLMTISFAGKIRRDGCRVLWKAQHKTSRTRLLKRYEPGSSVPTGRKISFRVTC